MQAFTLAQKRSYRPKKIAQLPKPLSDGDIGCMQELIYKRVRLMMLTFGHLMSVSSKFPPFFCFVLVSTISQEKHLALKLLNAPRCSPARS